MKLVVQLRALILACTVSGLLVGCGGGTTLAEGGIGGTGISMGPITGFGSIWVNGVRYDVSDAAFYRDQALAVGQADYRVGEQVVVTGSINADGVTGVAERVDYAPVLSGTVTVASTDGVRIEVLGQRVLTDSLTVLYGFALLDGLQPGQWLEVSGSRDADGNLYASSISLNPDGFVAGVSRLQAEGQLRALDAQQMQFRLDKLLVDYAGAVLDVPGGVLTAGQVVRVESMQTLQDGRLVAERISAATGAVMVEDGQEFSLEGRVTAMTDSTHFSINGQPVSVSEGAEFEHGSLADVRLNSLVGVEGVMRAGVLVAEEVSVNQTSSDDTLELEGQITALDLAAGTLVVMGNTVLVDRYTVLLDDKEDDKLAIHLADLNVHDLIEVKGEFLADGRIRALRIDRESGSDVSDTEREVKGRVQAVNEALGTLQVAGALIEVDGDSVYEDADENSISRAAFFRQLVIGQTVIEVEGVLSGDRIRALSLKVED